MKIAVMGNRAELLTTDMQYLRLVDLCHVLDKQGAELILWISKKMPDEQVEPVEEVETE